MDLDLGNKIFGRQKEVEATHLAASVVADMTYFTGCELFSVSQTLHPTTVSGLGARANLGAALISAVASTDF